MVDGTWHFESHWEILDARSIDWKDHIFYMPFKAIRAHRKVVLDLNLLKDEFNEYTCNNRATCLYRPKPPILITIILRFNIAQDCTISLMSLQG